MKVKSIVNRFKKHNLHWQIEKRDPSKSCNRSATLKHNGYVLKFSTNPCTEAEWMDMEAWSIHIRREDDVSDILTDYFAGFHTDTIKSALYHIGVGGNR